MAGAGFETLHAFPADSPIANSLSAESNADEANIGRLEAMELGRLLEYLTSMPEPARRKLLQFLDALGGR